jgi:hypothetical protein
MNVAPVGCRRDGGISNAGSLRNQLCPMGHDRLRGDGSSPIFRRLLASKPLYKRDGGPAYPEYPSERSDASECKPRPGP